LRHSGGQIGAIIQLENLSIQWAVGLLRYIDFANGHDYISKMEQTDYWKNFILKIEKHKYSEQMKQVIKSKYYYETITKTIKRLMITPGDHSISTPAS